MKKITLSEFKKLPAEELQKSPCLELTFNGQTVAFIVIGSDGEMKERIKGLSGLIDSGRGV